MTRDPYKIVGTRRRFTSLREQLGKYGKKPRIGLTQGGSSRDFAGAQVAATDGMARPEKLEDTYDPRKFRF